MLIYILQIGYCNFPCLMLTVSLLIIIVLLSSSSSSSSSLMIVSCLSYSFVWCCLLTVLAFLYCIHIDIYNFIIFLVFCSLIVRCCVLFFVKQHGFRAHQYADDTQLYGCCEPGNSVPLCHLSICVDDVAQWMRSNRLQLNAGKTEFMWCVPPRRRYQLPSDQLTVQSASIAPVESVRDLGVYLDSDMSMHTHMSHSARATASYVN